MSALMLNVGFGMLTTAIAIVPGILAIIHEDNEPAQPATNAEPATVDQSAAVDQPAAIAA